MKSLTSCLTILLALVLIESATLWEAVAVGLSTHSFLTFLQRIGDRFALPECMGFIAALEILLIPAITYWVFPISMPIESDTYFRYALPAYIAFVVGLSWSQPGHSTRPHYVYIQAVATYLQDKQQASLILFFIGLGGFTVKMIVPSAPTFISLLPSNCLFISALYAYYSKSAFFLLISVAALLVISTYTIQQGMFGDLFLWTMLLTLLVAAGSTYRITARQKTGFVVLAFATLLVMQSIKVEYRLNTWGHQRNERSGNANLMGELITDRLANPEKVMNVQHLFSAFIRFNQGLLIGSAMAKVPVHENFANGEVLLSFLHPLVPRFIWADKPQTGGYENIRRFTSLRQNENTSMNLSPLGEGYVNFGYGGILFSLAWGTLLGFVFQFLIRLSDKIPSVLLWIPALFFGCLTMETDILSAWGSLLNTSVFVALLYWSLRQVNIFL
ncbi:hypothetical protein IC229_29475 [Spirosoma sp. BT702]|uniref:Oligosaccharide repeat unit polymerase n=1 Tax=Spirosoma profusum TaxID=2771354 RepID=A0A927GA01_9BACT|nr:hypothetical protein [Spirosoma profusum]MBD2704799.1 hypothetical protein [Spirosoma profusum]